MTSAVPIATRHGTFVAQFNDIGLCRLDFPGKARALKPAPKPTGLAKRRAVCRRLTSRPEPNSSKRSGRSCSTFRLAKPARTARSLGAWPSRVRRGPSALPAALTRSRSLSRATGCWRRTGALAVSPAAPAGSRASSASSRLSSLGEGEDGCPSRLRLPGAQGTARPTIRFPETLSRTRAGRHAGRLCPRTFFAGVWAAFW